jgi:O-antigen/teichoic acid export membrane protein
MKISLRVGRIATFVDETRTFLPLLREIGATGGARVYSTLLSLAGLILTARWLGPEGRGIVVVITTWAALVAGIAHLSLGQVLVHRAANMEGKEWVESALPAVAAFTAIASLAGWSSMVLVYGWGGERLFAGIPAYALALGMTAVPFLIWEQYGSALLSIVGRLRTYNIAQIVGRSFGLIMLVVAIKVLGLGIYGFLIGFVSAQLLVACIGLTALFAHAGQRNLGLRAMGPLVRDGLKLHLNAVGALLFTGIDILMLQYFRGPEEAAIFQLPMQLILALLLVPQAAQLSLQGRAASQSRVSFWREHRLIMALIIGAMAVIAVMLLLLAPWIVTMIGGSGFGASIPVFQLLLFGVPWACFNTLMSVQWIIRGYFLRVSLLTFAAGLLNCMLNLFLIPRYGAIGAAIATVAGINIIPLTANLVLAGIAQREMRRG